RQISRHLRQLAAARDQAVGPGQQLEAVLTMYALIQHEHHDTELAALLHRGEHIMRAQQELHDFITGLITEGAAAGDIRDDVTPGELAAYCLHALTAAGGVPSQAAVQRLVAVTLAGLRPAASAGDSRDASNTALRPAGECRPSCAERAHHLRRDLLADLGDWLGRAAAHSDLSLTPRVGFLAV